MIALNTQPPERPGAGTVDAVELTGPPFLTIQGEGPYTGRRAVFVRLAGCNLSCSRCDTLYTTNRRTFAVSEVGEWMKDLAGVNLVHSTVAVITGGEPFRQLGLAELMRHLAEDVGFDRVQVETNGTLFLEDVMKVMASPSASYYTVVCSPKSRLINGGLMAGMVHYWKYVLAADAVSPDDGLPLSVLGQKVIPYRPPPTTENVRRTFVNPEWSDDPAVYAANVEACVRSCLKFGYRMGLQVHKLVHVP